MDRIELTRQDCLGVEGVRRQQRLGRWAKLRPTGGQALERRMASPPWVSQAAGGAGFGQEEQVHESLPLLSGPWSQKSPFMPRGWVAFSGWRKSCAWSGGLLLEGLHNEAPCGCTWKPSGLLTAGIP